MKANSPIVGFIAGLLGGLSIVVALSLLGVMLAMSGNFEPHRSGHWLVGIAAILVPFLCAYASYRYRRSPDWAGFCLVISGCAALAGEYWLLTLPMAEGLIH